MKELVEHRLRIDEIDDQIIDLLSRRFTITRKIGGIKARKKVDLIDQEREAQILSRLVQKSQEQSLNPELIRGLFQAILLETVNEHENQSGLLHK
ncbi:MAG: chorismate mutase [Bacteroidales bacterium]